MPNLRLTVAAILAITARVSAQEFATPAVDRIATVLSSSDVLAIAAGNSCSAIVKCAVAAGKAVGARWVVMAKVSKTSNPIWLLTAQLIRAETGEILLNDSTELKGEPDAMVRVGTRIFAERVARTVRSGGVVNDYPNGVPR